jgi:hypothetical protein
VLSLELLPNPDLGFKPAHFHQPLQPRERLAQLQFAIKPRRGGRVEAPLVQIEIDVLGAGRGAYFAFPPGITNSTTTLRSSG